MIKNVQKWKNEKNSRKIAIFHFWKIASFLGFFFFIFNHCFSYFVLFFIFLSFFMFLSSSFFINSTTGSKKYFLKVKKMIKKMKK